MAYNRGFNAAEMYQLKPRDRFTVEVYEIRHSLIYCLTGKEYLTQMLHLEDTLYPLYRRVNSKSDKPFSKNYMSWRKNLSDKIKAENITNERAVAKTIYRQLGMIMREARLTGGDDLSAIGIVVEDESKVPDIEEIVVTSDDD